MDPTSIPQDFVHEGFDVFTFYTMLTAHPLGASHILVRLYKPFRFLFVWV